MATPDTAYVNSVREQLLSRRARLEDVLARSEEEQFSRLLHEVDHALEKIDAETYGLCEVCHDTVETDRLIADPLVKVCLGCLSPAQQRSLEYDLELAAQIQQVSLPACDTSFSGWDICYHYQPAGVISGDYCDLISDGKGGLYFILADVAGKGVAAALLSSNLRAMFRALIPMNFRVENLLAHASRLFRESTLPTQYATLVFGHATAAGELQLVNAGHLPALLVQKSGITIFESNNLPLGMFGNQEFTASRALLAPDDTLVLYTDGVTEAQNAAGEEYGVDAVRRLVEQKGMGCPEKLVHACREHLQLFRGDGARADDETLLAIQYTPAAGAAAGSRLS